MLTKYVPAVAVTGRAVLPFGCAARPWRRLARPRLMLSMAVALAAALACMALAVADDDVSRLGPIKFDIQAQPLVDALQAYSVATGVQVMFETSSAVGYRSTRVQGEFTPDAALRLLLTGTDLTVRYTQAKAITLAPLAPESADIPPASVLTHVDLSLDTLWVSGAVETNTDHVNEYIGVVQSDIQKALKRAVKTHAGDYRAGIRIWVDRSRMVQRTELFRSTGDKDRDTLIASALQGLVLSRPTPANTPQPFSFMIAVHAL
jgi:hypothetical protein